MKAVRKILDKFPAGATVAVYYNPVAPDRSRLTPREPAHEFYLDVMFAALFSLFGIGFLMFRDGAGVQVTDSILKSYTGVVFEQSSGIEVKPLNNVETS